MLYGSHREHNHPKELVEELQVGPSLVYKTLFRVEDQEGSPEDGERRNVCVEYPDGVPGQDEGATELRSSRGVVRKAKEQEAGPQGHWGQEAWIEGA